MPCIRSCAVTRIYLSWWEKEEERLLRGRVCEGDSRRSEWLAELAEVQESLQRLRRETRLFAPSFRGEAFRAGFQGSRAQARPH